MANGARYEGRLPAGNSVAVSVAGGRISDVQPIPDRGELPWLLPVLVDLQQNGALGTPYNDLAVQGIEKLDAIATHLRRHGVGRCQATLTTYDPAGLRRSAQALDQRLSRDADMAALFFAFFHEGLYISPQDGWRGAHPRQWIEPPNYDRFRELDAVLGGRIRTVNVAPEEPGGLDFVERAVRDGKVVSLGHCRPSAEVVREAVRRGASMVTHFCNGAAPQVHRHRNPFWAFLDEPQLRLGLICDGFHLPPEIVRVALRCKGRENCLPVSDASGYAGCPPGDYIYPGHDRFTVESNGYLHLTGSEILSGAWFNQDRCVEFLTMQAGMPFLDAWAQCSTVPAAFAGIRLPEVKPGEEASFVLAQWSATEGLTLMQAVHRGRAYLTAPMRPTGL